MDRDGRAGHPEQQRDLAAGAEALADGAQPRGGCGAALHGAACADLGPDAGALTHSLGTSNRGAGSGLGGSGRGRLSACAAPNSVKTNGNDELAPMQVGV